MKLPLSLVINLLLATGILAQPVSHNNGQSVTGNVVSALSVNSFSVPSGTYRLLVACTTNAINSPAPSLTFDGTPMVSAQTRNTTSGLRLSMFYLALGSNVTANSGQILASGTGLLQLGAASYSNVNQTTPTDGNEFNTIVGGSTSSSVVIASSANKLACDCISGFAAGFTTFTADAGQSQLFQSNASSPNTRLAMSNKSGTTSTAMGWTINGNFTNGTGMQLGLNLVAQTPLPVKLISFTGKNSETGFTLQWQTASEVDNSGFSVERSSDLSVWTTLGFVSATGSENQKSAYSWPDQSPLDGSNYYRLKLLDLDGSYAYSPIISGFQKTNSSFAVYPNPASSTLFYQYGAKGEVHQIRLYDASGKLVKDSIIRNGEVPVSALPTGLYQLVLSTNNGTVYRRFVKE